MTNIVELLKENPWIMKINKTIHQAEIHERENKVLNVVVCCDNLTNCLDKS